MLLDVLGETWKAEQFLDGGDRLLLLARLEGRQREFITKAPFVDPPVHEQAVARVGELKASRGEHAGSLVPALKAADPRQLVQWLRTLWLSLPSREQQRQPRGSIATAQQHPRLIEGVEHLLTPASELGSAPVVLDRSLLIAEVPV